MQFKTINGVNHIDTGIGAPIVWFHGIGEIGKDAQQIADRGILKHCNYTAPSGVRIICIQQTSKDQIEQADRGAQLIRDLGIKPVIVGWSFGGAVVHQFLKKHQDLITGAVSISMADINDSGLESVHVPIRYAHAVNDSQPGCPVRASDEAFARIGSVDKFYFRFPSGNHSGPPAYICNPAGLKYGDVKFNLYDWCKELSGDVVIPPKPDQLYINDIPTGITDPIRKVEYKQ